MRKRYLIIILIFFLLATGCKSSDLVETATPTSEKVQITIATETPVPTLETITPTIQPVTQSVWFVKNKESDSIYLELLELTKSYAKTYDLEFVEVEDIDSIKYDEDVKIVINYQPDPQALDSAVANPDVIFVFIGSTIFEENSNMNQILVDEDLHLKMGFIAGYIAVVTTEDWRVGVAGASDTRTGEQSIKGFEQGAKFFCGFCRPAYPPFYEYPTVVEVNTSQTSDQILKAFEAFEIESVGSVYVSPEITNQALIDYFSDKGISMINPEDGSSLGINTPIAIVGIGFESLFESIWEKSVNDIGGTVIQAEYSVKVINVDVLTPGRQILVEKMVDDLNSGLIYVQP